MTNESIITMYPRPDPKNMERALNLARADEREKITEETVKEYFAGLNGKETALVVLNYLLRGGITDDDLRGLRLQWIKEQPEGVDVWVSWGTHFTFLRLSTEEPAPFEYDGGVSYISSTPDVALPEHLGNILGVKEGECAKFNIVRCV